MDENHPTFFMDDGTEVNPDVIPMEQIEITLK